MNFSVTASNPLSPITVSAAAVPNPVTTGTTTALSAMATDPNAVRTDEGVRCVAVGRDDGRILGRVHPGRVVDLVERALVLGGVPVDEILMEHPVVHDQREAVDEGFLGDRFCGQRRRGAG
jgi:hypothetical protein